MPGRQRLGQAAAEHHRVAVPITWVDAFTDQPFAGNPAAVCVLPGAAPDAWMQSIARELGISETAFVHRDADGWRLRWFTPVVEVDLCGHATIAAAHTLWSTGHVPTNDAITFHTLSGPLHASATESWIELDFPSEPAVPAAPPGDLLAALGLARASWVGKNRLDWLVVLGSDTAEVTTLWGRACDGAQQGAAHRPAHNEPTTQTLLAKTHHSLLLDLRMLSTYRRMRVCAPSPRFASIASAIVLKKSKFHSTVRR